jgi:hypothetical protein
MTGTRPVNVFGRFAPAERWHECVMQDGSTLDLSGHTDTWMNACTFEKSNVTRHVTFADNATITIDLHGRSFGNAMKIVGWDEPPANLSTLTFQLDDESAKHHALVCREDGIFIFCGLVILIQ